MGTRDFAPRHAVILPIAVSLLATAPAAAQDQPPPSALINQETAETVAAARAASPHTAESTYAYFQEEAETFIAEATQRMWDPTEPRQESRRERPGAIQTWEATG